MKINKLGSSLLIAAAVGMSSMAMADPVEVPWTSTVTTLAQWEATGSITDGDGDMRFGPITASSDLQGVASEIGVSITEVQIKGNDYYTVGFDLPVAGWSSSGSTFTYTATQITPEGLNLARLDTDVDDSVENVTEKLYNGNSASGTSFLQLASTSGISDQTTTTLPNTFTVVDTLNADGGFINHVDNVFTVTVPEPYTLVLMAIGFAAMGYSSRRVNPMLNNLMA